MQSRHSPSAPAALVLAAAAVAACSPDRPAAVTDPGPRAAAPALQVAQEPAPGAVYTMNNDLAGNHVVVLRRGTDGTLTPAGTYPTGGRGSGAFEDSDNSIVLGDAHGESAPNNLTEARSLLFVTNAGSNDVTVFRVTGDGTTLELADRKPSGGRRPVSVTVNAGRVYVLNSGERIFGLSVVNCTTGDLPSVTGFTVSAAGVLTPIPGSTRMLSGDRRSGCAQVSFTADGRHLVVTERLSRAAGQAPPDEGTIDVYPVSPDGTLGAPVVVDATGRGPFGFTPTRDGLLLVTEQNGGPANPGGGAAAAYRVNADGTLTPTSPSVPNGGTDTCWFVVDDAGVYAYAVSFFGAGRVSTYRVGADGSLTLVEAADDDGNAGLGASDASLSANSEFLYQLNSIEGTVKVYAVGADGRLTFVQSVQAHAPSPGAARVGLAAF
jgi:6-phosphogluconolactonase (cycloisomerase 2 family)